MTQAVSVTIDMSNVTLASFGASAYSIPASVPASSISGTMLPPEGEVLRLSFHLPERSAQVNPALWRLDMEFSQDDTDDLASLMERGETRVTWTPEPVSTEGGTLTPDSL